MPLHTTVAADATDEKAPSEIMKSNFEIMENAPK